MPKFLVLTTEDAPGCLVGSAVNRLDLEAPFDPWPGHEMAPDDGRALWVPPLPVPEAVPNADLRIVLQSRLLPDGRSCFTAANDYLAGSRDATAGLDDADPAKQAALAAWTQWDMGNFFHRSDPLVAALGGMFGLAEADLDALFQAAGARG